MATKAEKLVAKGRALQRKGKLDKALAYYRSACEHERHDPQLWQSRADVARDLGDTGDAVESLFYAADLLARGGILAGALSMVDKVLALDGKHSGARRLKAMLEDELYPPEPQPEPEAQADEAQSKKPKGKKRRNKKIRKRRHRKTDEVTPSNGGSPPQATEVIEPKPEPVPRTAEPDLSPAEGAADGADEDDIELERSGRQLATSVEIEADYAEEGEAIPEPVEDRVAVPVDRSAPSSISEAVREFRMGRVTGELALDDVSLSRLLGSGANGGAVDIEIDDEPDAALVRAVAATVTSSPLLSELDSDLVRRLVDAGKLVHRIAGQPVFRQGEGGTSLYLVLKGRASVQRDGVELASLRAGAFFGEMALLTNAPRSASVIAETDADLLAVSRKVIRELIDREPRVLKLLMRFFRARLVGTLLQTSPLFTRFESDEKRNLIARFRLRELSPGHLVVRQGERSDGLYLVLVGRLEVFTGGEIAAPQSLGDLGPGDVFGEMSLLDGTGAMANVRTDGRCWVLLLPRQDFTELISSHPQMLEEVSVIAERRRAANEDRLATGRALTANDKVRPV